MQNIRKWGAWLGAGAVIFTLAGCADRNGNGQAESPATANEVGNAVADNLGDTANAASGAVGTVSNAASSAGNAISSAASKVPAAASGALDAITITPKVKTALGANAGLKGSVINVDTLGSKDTVALRGSVKTQGQKKLAESLAKGAAPGYKIANQLKVSGK